MATFVNKDVYNSQHAHNTESIRIQKKLEIPL